MLDHNSLSCTVHLQFEVNYLLKRLGRFSLAFHAWKLQLTTFYNFAQFMDSNWSGLGGGRGGVADKSCCDRVFDSVWPHSLQKNTRQEEELYKGTLLRCANENFPQEDT